MKKKYTLLLLSFLLLWSCKDDGYLDDSYIVVNSPDKHRDNGWGNENGNDTVSADTDNRPWYEKCKVTAHAGGGVIDPETFTYRTYTNSKEAIERSYALGLRCFEIDIDFTVNNTPVLSHDWDWFYLITGVDTTDGVTDEEFINAKIFGSFTPMTFRDVVDFMIEHPDTYFDLDTKDRSPRTWVPYLIDICKEKAGDHYEELADRFIIEFYSESNYFEINNHYPFKNYFYSLYMQGMSDLDGIIDFCKYYQIPVAGCNQPAFTEEIVSKFEKNGIHIICYNGLSDNYPDCMVLKTIGIYGIQSDFVLPEQWDD